ncbi:glycosyltransferase family 2 protein [Aliikangiella coralliicola]|uniref:Glycosyltransferase family 2 protein n=1 Tax=Aliikangiella coralliicola TaxID=2592383 RepID=A0A545UFG1_9GAMM|nr:glycosyltransferase family 2 protein [Aliikangiella coralliicola]TQV88209.1 glycosyltransferase family 2 protein [Aliikangiella coralliicola]
MSKKLSVCIICKNEQKNIERCLQSVAWADEIIVLDSGSTDNTLEIAKRYTDKVFVREDWVGFGKQRQRAEALASNEWIFAIDCDEVVSEELRQEIVESLTAANEKTVIMINRLTSFCGQFIYHSGWYPDYVHRIYNRKHFGYNDKLVHEAVNHKGAQITKLKQNLLHYQYDDMHLYLAKRNNYANISATEKFEKGKSGSLTRAVLSSVVAFIRHYFFRRGFLDGRIGFAIAVIQMQYTFNKYMFLLYKKPK